MNVGFSESTFLCLVCMVFFVFAFRPARKEQNLDLKKKCVP